VVYTGEVFSVVSGGIDRKTEYLDNIDLTLTIDAEELWGWEGVTFFVYGLGNHGGDPSRTHIGDTQGISNIETVDTWKLYEAWVEQNLFDDRLSLLVGLHDMNSEFDVIETAGLFLNSSHGIAAEFSQTGLNGPSIFPTTSLAARLRFQPTDEIYFQGAVYDAGAGDPDEPKGTQILLGKGEGVLLVSEAGYTSGIDDDTVYRKFAVGAWYYTAEFDDVFDVDAAGAPEKENNYGLYGIGEYQIYQESQDANQGLAVFIRVGIANEDVNQVEYYTGGGLVYTGLLPERDEDQLGVAVAIAHNGNGFEKASTDVGNREIVIEGTYRFQINPWFAIQPDIQYIVNPGTSSTIDDALVIGTRFEIVL